MLIKFASRVLKLLVSEFPASRRRRRCRSLTVNSMIESLETRQLLTGMVIVPTYDPATIGSLPNHAAIEATINSLISQYEAQFSDPITVNILFQGTTDPNSLAGSIAARDPVSYSTLRSALISHKSTVNDATAIAHLPNTSTDPILGHTTVGVSTANEKALGLIPANDPGSDGTIEINFSQMNVNRVSIDPNNYDLISTAAHEMDEVLGLGSNLPDSGDIWLQDLFRYGPTGARSYTTSTSVHAYFSLDGKNDLIEFNQTNDGADYGDWITSDPSDITHGIDHVQDAYGTPGVEGINDPNIEYMALDVQGYHFVGGAVPFHGAELRVNTSTVGNQITPSVAKDALGDYVIAWSSKNQDGSGYGVYAQRYNLNGVVQGAAFKVNTTTLNDQQSPKVAMNAAGAFVITWQSDAAGVGHDSIYAQRYSATGVAQGTEFRVNTNTSASSHVEPTIAIDNAGDFVIAWASYGQDGSGYGVYAQRYNSAGTAVGTEFRVSTRTTGLQAFPAAAMDATGDFVISWTSNNQDGNLYGVYAQRYTSAGIAAGSEFPVNTYTTGKQWLSSVSMDAAGDFVVAWSSFGQDGDNYGVYAQRYNSAGAKLGTEFRVNSYATNNQSNVAVAMDPAGNFVVTWSSYGQDGSKNAIEARYYNIAGIAQGSIFQVNTHTTENQTSPAVAVDAQGHFIVAWQSNLQDGSGFGIYSRAYIGDAVLGSIPATINHAPAGTTGTTSAVANRAYLLKATDFGFTDPNDNPPNSLAAVKITLLPTAGVLKDNGIAVTTNQFISAADIAAGKLIFTPVANLGMGTFFLCKFQVQDNGGTASGGVNLDPTAKVLYIKYGPFVNHAPIGTSKTVSGVAHTAYAIKTADFGFTDSNDSPPNTFLAVKITLLPGAGTLKDNGVAVTTNQFVSAADIAAGKLIFTPAASIGTGTFFVCKFQVEDNGGTANAGVNLDLSAKILDIQFH